jgi:hypothetical protein
MINSASGQTLSDVPKFIIIDRPRSCTTMLRFLFEAPPNIVLYPKSSFSGIQ